MAASSRWSQERYLDAYWFAARAHRGQEFPGTDGLPYVLHIGMVAMEVVGALQHEPAEQPDLAVQCALLHDTLEDTEATYEQLTERFGTAVADGARALSKDETLPKAERMPDSLRRIREQPREVWMVKLADRICNLQEPPHYWSSDKRARYRAEARDILAALGEASAYLAQRLQRRIDDYARYIE